LSDISRGVDGNSTRVQRAFAEVKEKPLNKPVTVAIAPARFFIRC
jgi:hypothetical protein